MDEERIVWDIRDESRYSEVSKLGHGSYGEVSLSVRKEDLVAHLQGGSVQKFAVKKFFVIAKNLDFTKTIAAREVRILRAVRTQPDCDASVICYVEHYVGNPSNDLFIVTRFSKGKIMYDVKPKSTKYFRAVLKSALEGLRFLHAKNIAHRDIKGDNVMIVNEDTAFPSVVYLDLGLGCRGADDCIRQPNAVTEHRSPEQLDEVLKSETLNMAQYKASDIWFLAQAIYVFGTDRSLFSTSLINAELKLKRAAVAKATELLAKQKIRIEIKRLEQQQLTTLQQLHKEMVGNDDNVKTKFMYDGYAKKMTQDMASQAIVAEMLKLSWRKRLLAAVGVAILEKYDSDVKKSPALSAYPKFGYITDYKSTTNTDDSDSFQEDL